MEIILKETEINTLKRAIDTYGVRSQEDVAVEEMSELTKAIIKHRRYNSGETMANLLEEIIDVQIMLIQLSLHYGIAGRLFSKKIDRLKKRLDEEDKKEEEKVQPTTNFDLMKNMNPEELAEFLVDVRYSLMPFGANYLENLMPKSLIEDLKRTETEELKKILERAVEDDL